MNLEFPSEQFIEDYVFSAMEIEGVCPISGEHVDYCLRQHEVKGYGITDILKLRVDSDEVAVTVLELKNEPLKESHLSQLCRYLTGMSRTIRRYRRLLKGRSVYLNGQLAGPVDPNKGDFVYLAQRHRGVECFDLSLTMENGFQSRRISRDWYNGGENRRLSKEIIRDVADCIAVVDDMAEYWKSRMENADG